MDDDREVRRKGYSHVSNSFLGFEICQLTLIEHGLLYL